MKSLPILVGSQVKLGAFTPNYIPIYHKWLQDPYVLKMTETSKNMTLKDVTNMQKEIDKDNTMAHFLIFDKRKEIAIGDIDLRDIEIGNTAEIAIMIAEPSYRGKGYASEAYKLIMNFGFKKFRLASITAPVLSFNQASIGFHKKMGFFESGKKGRDIIFKYTK